jgi:hypothetical protein
MGLVVVMADVAPGEGPSKGLGARRARPPRGARLG